jgi:hypothetical protein
MQILHNSLIILRDSTLKNGAKDYIFDLRRGRCSFFDDPQPLRWPKTHESSKTSNYTHFIPLKQS